MILFHYIVEILALSDGNGCLVDLIVESNRGRVAVTLVNSDLLREPVGPNRLA